MPEAWPVLLVIPVAVIDWIAVAARRHRLELLFKPLTMLVLIWAVLLSRPLAADSRQALWFLIGFVFSLGGDVFLMFAPEDRNGSGRSRFPFFQAGLGSFLMAHLAFIVGLSPALPPAPSLLTLVIILPVGAALLRRLLRTLRRSSEPSLMLPIALYSLVLTLMFFAAVATLFRSDWDPRRAAFAAAGGLLFFLSDSLLGWNRFVRPLPHGSVLVHVSYHGAQLLLAGSLL